jgi:hypothetical protein
MHLQGKRQALMAKESWLGMARRLRLHECAVLGHGIDSE